MITSYFELGMVEDAITNRDAETLSHLGISNEKIVQLFSIEDKLDKSSRAIHAT